MRFLILLIPSLLFSQIQEDKITQSFDTRLDSVKCEIVNDTLHIKGGLVQIVGIKNLNISKAYTLKEVAFGWYLLPLSNIEKGLYSLKIKGYKKNAPTFFFKNEVAYDPKRVDYLDGYYYVSETHRSSQEGKADKIKVVSLIERNKVDDITKNGRANHLQVYEIKHRKRKLVYEK